MYRVGQKQTGFTIVELLIVIVVIGILAALVIVAYNGISSQAKISALTSELSSFGHKIQSIEATDGQYPATLTDAGLSVNPNFMYQYTSTGTGFCLSFKQDATEYRYTNESGSVESGRCANGGGVTTLAGSTMGTTDGTGAAAQFIYPYDVAVNATGTVYVGANGENRIRQITPEGTVSLLAGFPVGGFTNATGSSARFSGPTGVAVSASGDIYVADTGNNAIRKITSAGVVTTFAGSSTAGSADGTGTAAQFNGPMALAFGQDGNLYVADTSNFRVRKITPAGVVTTLAGSSVGYAEGTGAAAQFRYLQGIAVASDNSVYVTDSGNRRVRKITPAGVVTTFAGSGVSGQTNGTGTAAQFMQPYALAMADDGTMYVSDIDNGYCLIRKITSSAVVTTFAGSTCGYLNDTGTSAQFDFIAGLAVDSGGSVYVADQGNNRIRKIQ